MKKKMMLQIECDSPDPPYPEEENLEEGEYEDTIEEAPEEEKCRIIIEGPESGIDHSHKMVAKYELLQKIEEGIPISKYLLEYPKRDISAEFQLLKKLTETKNHLNGLHELDKSYNKFNRYNNVIPYLHSEVTIHCASEDSHDSYINANFVNSSFGADSFFICTQGPLPSTRKQFWRMCIQERVSMVVMLSQVKEEGRVKCDQYWPLAQDEKLSLEEIEIRAKSVIFIHESLKLTLLEINDSYSGQSLAVKHIQYTRWPDHGTPELEESEAILSIYRMIKEEREAGHDSYPAPKIVVHCSAGIGRTGTVVALFNILSSLEKLIAEQGLARVSVFGTVRRLREQRHCMVQTLEQYKYIYEFIADWISNIQCV